MSSPDKKAIGARLREAREAPPYWSRAEMARQLRAAAHPLDRPGLPHVASLKDQIRQWERGDYIPGPTYRPLFAQVTGRTEAELFAEAKDAEAELVPLLGGHVPVNHRPADAAFVEAIRESSRALVRMDTIHGGNDLLPLALRSFRAAHHKLGAEADPAAVERDFIAATGEAGQVTAWLAYDADRQDVSRQIIHEALMLSRQAGDREMELFELTHLAMQSVHLRRPAEALRIAAELLDTDLPPRIAALFNIRRGRALAQLGHDGDAFEALEGARSTLMDSIAPQDPPWTWWITEAEVLWHIGMARAELGDWPAAVAPLRESAELRAAYPRARYNDLVHLLNALVHVADWREAEAVLTDVAGVICDVGSARTTNLLRRTTHRITSADPPSAVADLAEEVHRLLNAENSGGSPEPS